jgi:phosphoserine aminotransferase
MRVINFNPGPAGLPLLALERAKEELLDFQGTGMSVMEHSHRGKAFESVHHEALGLIRSLLGVPQSHTVFFSTGGASMQFALVPVNFLPQGKRADYVVTGGWSEKALEEAQRVGQARALVSTRGADGRYTRVPTPVEVPLAGDAAYVHTTSNNTLFGTQFHQPLPTGAVPHICDMSSDFMWAPLDVSKFALIYAGAQKNLGPSGIVVMVGQKDFIASARTDVPKIFRYQTHVEADSLYNTPPTLAIYLVRNVLRWVVEQGGLTALEARNRDKAKLLYGVLDRLRDFFTAPVEVASRSTMNVVFRTPSEALDAKFVSEAEKAGLVGLKGHRVTGGLRASLYNAVSVADVTALVQFIDRFAAQNG